MPMIILSEINMTAKKYHNLAQFLSSLQLK